MRDFFNETWSLGKAIVVMTAQMAIICIVGAAALFAIFYAIFWGINFFAGGS